MTLRARASIDLNLSQSIIFVQFGRRFGVGSVGFVRKSLGGRPDEPNEPNESERKKLKLTNNSLPMGRLMWRKWSLSSSIWVLI